MADILQIFTGNPLSTLIGRKIEDATSPNREDEDWGLYLEICDLINENDEDGKDAIKAIKKRLQQVSEDKNFLTTTRTLMLLEACVSNCSHRFRVLVMQREFIQELVKLIGPKNNPPIELQERVLKMIQRWADTFTSQPELTGVVNVYDELRLKGVVFPPSDMVGQPPIETPQRTVRNSSPANAGVGYQQANVVRTNGPPNPNVATLSPAPSQEANQSRSSRPTILEGDEYNKISNDLIVVKTSITMLDEVLHVLEHNLTKEEDWSLASDLNSTCRQMRTRIVELIERVANEDLTITLLSLNDDLINIFAKYDEAVQLKKKTTKTTNDETTTSSGSSPKSALNQASSSNSFSESNRTTSNKEVTSPSTVAPSTTSSLSANTKPRGQNEPSLIDFGAEESIDTNMDPFAPSPDRPQTSGEGANVAEELSRLSLNSQTQPNQQTIKRQAPKPEPKGLPEEISNFREQDFAEIENWLSSDAGKQAIASQEAAHGTGEANTWNPEEPTSLMNAEFENFLANRAMAAASSHSKTTTTSKKPEPSS